jgi:hypothetical protein
MPQSTIIKNWFTLSPPTKRLWWRETDYGNNEPSPKLIAAMIEMGAKIDHGGSTMIGQSDFKIDNPIVAMIDATAAREVAEFMESHVPFLDATRRKSWKEVMDALYAISNDTDVIMTREGS